MTTYGERLSNDASRVRDMRAQADDLERQVRQLRSEAAEIERISEGSRLNYRPPSEP